MSCEGSNYVPLASVSYTDFGAPTTGPFSYSAIPLLE